MTAYVQANDPYFTHTPNRLTPGNNAAAVTPSDTVDFTSYPKGIVVTAAGNLVVLPLKGADGTYITFTAAPVGLVVPFRVRRVQATGTTASCATLVD